MQTRRASLHLLMGVLLTGWLRNAAAHTGLGVPLSFGSGLLHPLLGWDHLLMLFGTGILAVRQRGTASWQLPLAFLLALLAGGSIAGLSQAIGWAESAVRLSIPIMGLLLLGKCPLRVALALVILAGVFHGYVHIQEASASGALSLPYGVGLLLGNIGVLGLGICFAQRLQRWDAHYAGLCLGLGTVAMFY